MSHRGRGIQNELYEARLENAIDEYRRVLRMPRTTRAAARDGHSECWRSFLLLYELEILCRWIAFIADWTARETWISEQPSRPYGSIRQQRVHLVRYLERFVEKGSGTKRGLARLCWELDRGNAIYSAFVMPLHYNGALKLGGRITAILVIKIQKKTKKRAICEKRKKLRAAM